MYGECPHGIVAGTCVWCMAEALEYESKVIETVRKDVRERETREAAERAKRRPAE